jgi:small membrane protein
MNLFQSLVLALFVVLSLLTLSAGLRGTVRKRIVAFWLALWAGGSVAVIWPHTTAMVAHSLGIGRGADLLLYSTALVMIVAFFYVYTRFRRVERQLTLLVRRLAMQNAEAREPPRIPSSEP